MISSVQSNSSPSFIFAPWCSDEPCTTTLDDARLGKISLQDYVNELQYCFPPAREALAEDILAGFLYDDLPAPDFKVFMQRVLLPLDLEQKEAHFLADDSTEGYSHFGSELALILPAHFYLSGRGMPSYVIFRDLFFNPRSRVETEEDVHYTLAHELQHVQDLYYGITLGNITLTHRNFSQKQMSTEFWQVLLELRAEYQALRRAILYMPEEGNTVISMNWFVTEVLNYHQHQGDLERMARTPLERRIVSLQQASSEIEVCEENGAPSLYFQKNECTF